jgi:ABC-type sugar transport system permease subunit/ABC-type glycerol-3-phosphate transport system permease component
MMESDSFGRTPREDAEAFSPTRLLVGIALLIPGAAIYLAAQLLPAFSTLAASQTDWKIIGASEYIGMANFSKLGSDATYGAAIAYTLLIVFARLVIVALIPPLVGSLVGAQRFSGRATNRLLLSVLAVLIAPVALSILLRGFLAPIWGRTPSPLADSILGVSLGSPNGARGAILLLDSVITLAIAAVVGGAAFMAVMRGREVSPSSSRAGIGVWLIGLLLALASAPHTFTLPFTLTQGGPANATTTLALFMYKVGFQFFDGGYASAQAVPMIVLSVIIGLLVGFIIWGFRLRLAFTPPAPPAEAASVLGFLSVPLIVLIGLPSLILVVWGLWMAAANNGFSQVSEVVNVGRTFANTVIGPWLAIWLVQIPITYLLGLSLGFVRPVNRAVSNIVFVILLALAFIPPEALSLQWYITLRNLGWINTHQGIGYGWIVSLFSLIAFKLFFDGAYDRYQTAREDGQTPTDAFLNTVLLPSLGMVLVIGAALSFASAQSLFWPLLVSSSQDQFGFPAQMFAVSGQFGAQFSTSTAVALIFIGLLGLIFLPVFALLQILVVDRLALLAGPEADWGKPKRALPVDKPKTGF